MPARLPRCTGGVAVVSAFADPVLHRLASRPLPGPPEEVLAVRPPRVYEAAVSLQPADVVRRVRGQGRAPRHLANSNRSAGRVVGLQVILGTVLCSHGSPGGQQQKTGQGCDEKRPSRHHRVLLTRGGTGYLSVMRWNTLSLRAILNWASYVALL